MRVIRWIYLLITFIYLWYVRLLKRIVHIQPDGSGNSRATKKKGEGVKFFISRGIRRYTYIYICGSSIEEEARERELSLPGSNCPGRHSNSFKLPCSHESLSRTRYLEEEGRRGSISFPLDECFRRFKRAVRTTRSGNRSFLRGNFCP